MWGSDEYDGFTVINQTAACLSLGWPPVQNTPAPLGGASEGAQQRPQSSFFPLILSPSPSTLHLTAITPILQSPWWQGAPSAEMLKKGLLVRLGRLGSRKTGRKGEQNIEENMVNKVGSRKKRRKWEGKNTGISAGGYQGAPLFVIPPTHPLHPPFAPTYWPVFNKAPVLGRFLSSSINCSREVTQGRERAREIESMRGRQRARESDGKSERERGRRKTEVKRRRVKLI